MLTELCAMLHNYFNIHDDEDIYVGTYAIENGSIESLPFLKEGQYFRIHGSALNDGVYQYPAIDLRDETFVGTITAMFVPVDVIRLAEDIEAYNERIRTMAEVEASKKGYSSESWGGYSYSLFGAAPPGMEVAKADIDSRLRRYRKLVIF